METEAFRRQLVGWLDANTDQLTSGPDPASSLDASVAQFRRVKQALWDADFGRYGWPERTGGLGGPTLLRAVVSEEVAARDLADVGAWSMIEVLAPTVIEFGSDELVAAMLPPMLRGEEIWCQGFSEPDAGSDLASLACKATRADGGWVINGQKVWTSYIHYAHRGVLLARTGDADSAHRGITAFFIDVDRSGVSYSPLVAQHGESEFAEVFFDDAFVPDDRVLGEVGQGWQIAMNVLPYERSTTFWHRGAHLQRLCRDLVAELAADDEPSATSAKALGEAYQSLFAFRSRSRDTQYRLAGGGQLGAETSIDKILIGAAEQQLLETTRTARPGVIEFDTTQAADLWRTAYLYSKAATIYGGTGEIQRNIVARRLLDLGPEA